ncbi:hypothetical protein BDB00DRAFT_848210 [Zychaea mexicana]|uniref:uncharacterized protein n=1 Tax=Zychaea mexicana TaxID=64656 RepID=UPI0022FDCE67|nr:uncharacterized protein BDB00DRAFT_848210 [Zychaea mexicana]KAI9488378.1 hypothetical protein BDB00DRAFT_848210 [Zychaea mexicana]
MPYAADLQHNLRSALDKVKYLEGVVRAQDERLRQPQGNGSLHTIQNIHTTMVNELKKQHRVEMKLLQKENQTLAKKFMRISCTLQRIEKMGLAPENAQLDVKDLREERRVLMRKLHLTELRLRARDAELNYLHSLAWSKQQRHQPSDDDDTGDHDDHDDEQLHKHDKSNNDTIVGRLSPSAYLLQKQSSPVLQPKQQQKQATTTGNRPISALDSLSILADQMLSDPDFGSEGKESSASPECDSATPTTALMTAYPQQSLHELHKRNEQHYRYVEKGNTSAATTSPVRIKKEVNGRETPSSTPSVLPYNKRKRGGDDQQQQQQQPLSPLGYYNNYHHGNVMPYYRGGRKVEELNNESSVMRPSSAFHTIIPIHHPQSKHRHQGTTIPPVNIVPRPLLPPSSMTTKDKVIGTSNTAAAAATTSGLPLGTLMSPVPSSAYHHHPSYHHQQQSYNSNQHHLHYHQHHHINDLSPASSTEENRKRRWSLDMSENKKKNSPPQPM